MTLAKDYFVAGRNEDKRELKLTKEAIKKAGKIFPETIVKDQWPYELFDSKPIIIPTIPDSDVLSYSQSTNAMVLFSLIASSGKSVGSSLIPQVNLIEPFNFQNNKDQYEDIWNELIARTEKEKNGKKDHFTYSSTFGKDDPFTLAWMIEIERSKVFKINDRNQNLMESFIKNARERVENTLNSSTGSQPQWLSWDKKQRFSIDHAFLALRYVQLHKCLSKEETVKYPTWSTWLTSYFDNRIHQQLSKFEILDGDFDAAELVFALEGILHLKPSSVSRSLLDRIFSVITESQTRNPYWRPVKPIVATPQGRVLFPLSVETASSLLRCCNLIEIYQKDPTCFSQNVELFRRYSEWLRSRIVSGVAIKDHKEINFYGWHSEHVHLHPGIHLWETSNVLLYFHYYTAMLEKHIARRSLEAANLFEEIPWKENQKYSHMEYWEKERTIIEPFQGKNFEKLQPYAYAGTHIISPRTLLAANNHEMSHSVLLYGPPGTGKTVFAEEICKALKWPLVTVTPSDFIHGGENEVESRAKRIFEVLEDQFEMVILFDEIDRMILDRASDGYAKQGDIFQFMTPSMLTKLRNLRKKERVIFIIATNYKERIDPAAIRKGRIDTHLIMPPPNKTGRTKILGYLISEEHHKDQLASPRLATVAEKTNLLIYGEIKNLFDDINTDSKDEQDPYNAVVSILEQKTRESGNSGGKTLTLMSYKSRFKNSAYPQMPFSEFLVLLYLKLEVKAKLDEQEIKLTNLVLRKMAAKEESVWEELSLEKKKKLIEEKIKTTFSEIHNLAEIIVSEFFDRNECNNKLYTQNNRKKDN